MMVKASRRGIYVPCLPEGQRTAVLVEGEFDAMLLNQEAGDLVFVATLGSASAQSTAALTTLLEGFDSIFIAFDADAAGWAGAAAMQSALPSAGTVTVPAADLTDAWRAETDLRGWFVESLTIPARV